MDPTLLERLWIIASGKIDLGNLKNIVRDSYLYLLRTQASEIGRVLTLLADASHLPLLVHCRGGKDRTGLVIALLQSVLGVPFDAIANDYLLTNELAQGGQKELLRMLRWLTLFRASTEELMPVVQARLEYLEGAFEYIERASGTAERFLVQHAGLSIPTLDSIRTVLLDTRAA